MYGSLPPTLSVSRKVQNGLGYMALQQLLCSGTQAFTCIGMGVGPRFHIKQVKPGFTNYQPQPKYSWALSKIEGKGKLGKTKDF